MLRSLGMHYTLPNQAFLHRSRHAHILHCTFQLVSITADMVAIIPDAIVIATTHADEKDIKKITALGDEVEELINNHEDQTQKDIEFHTAIAMSSKNVVVPRLIPVINSSIPLFVEKTGGTLHEETIETHREIADTIASHDTLRAQDAMYLHLVYNRKRIQMMKK